MGDLYGRRFQCENCGGRHSLAKYEDGNYCWKCGTVSSSKSIAPSQPNTRILNSEEVFVTMPLSGEQIEYLAKFHFTEDRYTKWELEQTNLFSTSSYLFIPVRIDGEITFAQLKDHTKKGRTQCYGKKPAIFYDNKYLWVKTLQSDRKQTIVIVEDPISAMNVADAGYNTISLFGNRATPNMVRLLISQAKRIENVVTWFDNDTGGITGCTDIIERLRVFYKIDPVFTTKDPKYYNKHEIQDIISNKKSVLRTMGYE